MGNKHPSGKQISTGQQHRPSRPNPVPVAHAVLVPENESEDFGKGGSVASEPAPPEVTLVESQAAAPRRDARRKSDPAGPGEKLVIPVSLALTGAPVKKQDGLPLQRAKSALPPSTATLSMVGYMARSKSMPVVSYRRADINLDEEAVAEAARLQENLKVTLTKEPTMRALSEEALENFLRSCEGYMYGCQKLTGVPGQERGHAGITPPGVAVSCIKGLKGSHDASPNQDNYAYCKYQGYEFYTVQDGHGPGGHFVSFRGVRSLPYFVIKSRHFPNFMKAAITEGYERCHAEILMHSVEQAFDVQISGCACTLVVRKGNKIWLSHAGDSRVVVGTLQSSNVIVETNDHKPTHPEERQRLEASGAEIQTFTFGADVSISRVFVKGTDFPGLCMSRSLGDQSVKEHGVLPTPEVSERTMKPGEEFMVLASDGVWEFVPSKLVCSSLSKKLVAEGKDKCVNRIVTESKKRWKSNEGTYCDDITAMLVLF